MAKKSPTVNKVKKPAPKKAKKKAAKKRSAPSASKTADLDADIADGTAILKIADASASIELPPAITEAHRRATALAPEIPSAGEGVTVSYKGFNAKLKCQDYQFEFGVSYEHAGKVVCCPTSSQVVRGDGGFHACPVEHHPLSVFKYYPPAGARYAYVYQSGTIAEGTDCKIASAKITIGVELNLPQLVASAVRWVHQRVNWKDAVHVQGDNEGALNQTVNGAATASGYQGAATASGDRGACLSSGCGGKVKAAEGNAMFLVYRATWDGAVEKVWAGIAGQDGIKPNTWYSLGADGKPVELG